MTNKLIPKKIFTSIEDVEAMLEGMKPDAGAITSVSVNLTTSGWVTDGDLKSSTVIHNFNTENIFVNVINSDLKESMLDSYKIIDANTIKVYNDVAVNCVVTVFNGNNTIEKQASEIDDVNVSTSKAWSSSKTNTEVNKAIQKAEEAFQNADSGKTLLATTIGSPVVSSDTFQQMDTKLNTIKDGLKRELDRFKSLIS